MAKPPSLGRAELQILQYITDHHPITVGQVAEYFANATGLARTTVLTVMDRLRGKGYLTRKKVEGVYRYAPKLPKESLLQSLVREFVSGALGGSLAPFVAYLTHEAHVSEEQLKELKQLVQDLEGRRKGRTP